MVFTKSLFITVRISKTVRDIGKYYHIWRALKLFENGTVGKLISVPLEMLMVFSDKSFQNQIRPIRKGF